MNMIYNSSHYCVVEFPTDEAAAIQGGFEIMDKTQRREIFLRGMLADKFRDDVMRLIASEPSVDEVDEFLGNFGGLMQQPMVLH